MQNESLISYIFFMSKNHLYPWNTVVWKDLLRLESMQVISCWWPSSYDPQLIFKKLIFVCKIRVKISMHQIFMRQISYASNLLCLRFLFVHPISENMHQISNCASNLPCLKFPMPQISNCASNLCAPNLPCTKFHAPNWIHQIGFTKFSCIKSSKAGF